MKINLILNKKGTKKQTLQDINKKHRTSTIEFSINTLKFSYFR